MAGVLFEGAALGAAFGELLKAVLDVTHKTVEFESILKRLKLTMKSLTPIVEEILKSNKKLDRSEEEMEVLIKCLKEGEKLVRKCLKVTWWNCYKRPIYSKKLLELEESIRRFFNFNMPALIHRNTSEISVGVNEINTKIDDLGNRIGGLHHQNGNLSSCGVPDPPSITVGLDVPLRELKKMLLKDGETLVVLSAPGGCGKTTLAKKLCQDEEVKGKFKNNILFVTISKTPDLKVILQKLIQHKRYQVPEFKTDDDAVHQLEQLLKQLGPDPVLLVLDDVWSGSESLLEKFVFQIPEYRILVTSRFVFPRFDSTYKLKLLNDTDAMELFRCSAFPQNGNAYAPSDDLVNKIVRNCKGFPLALKVVGRSLYGQPIEVWKIRVKEWSKGQSIFDSDSDLLNCLKTSLDALNGMIVKECFMDLASFPEDQRIRTAALIDMWMEMYELDEDGLYANAYLHDLYTRNLVNLLVTRKDGSEVESGYNGHFVTQHDLLRDLANHQSSQGLVKERKRLIVNMSGNNLPNWCLELKQQPSSACLLSISTDEMFTSSWFDMELPEVEVLILNFQTKCYALPSFIEKMGKLKVLIVTNYGFCPAELSNIAVLSSLSNIKIIRFERVSIPDLSEIIIALENLQKISLVMCNINQAFQNCSLQLSNMFPNLTEIDIDYCNDLEELPEGICDLVRLRKLSVTNCGKLSELPERIGDLASLEVLRLHSCTNLSTLPDSFGSLHKLTFLDISECLSLEELPEQMDELYNLQKLYMIGSHLSELPESLMNLEQLKDIVCDKEMAYRLELLYSHLTNLNVRVPEEDINLDWLHSQYF